MDIVEFVIGMLIPVCISLISIPITAKDLIKKLNGLKEKQLEIQDSKINLKNLKEMYNGYLNSAPREVEKADSLDFGTDEKESTQQSKNTSTSSSKLPKFDNSIFSSKTITLKELYEKRNLDKSLKKISFVLAVIMSIVGTIILFAGIVISLFFNKDIGWITTSSGAIIELVASIYFWLVNRTMKEVKDNSKQLEKTEDLLTAIELVERLSDSSIKDEVYKDIIVNLMNQEK